MSKATQFRELPADSLAGPGIEVNTEPPGSARVHRRRPPPD